MVADRTLGRSEKGTDSSRSLLTVHWGCLITESRQPAQALLAVPAPHPCTLHTVVSSLCALLTAARVSSGRQLKSSTESQSKASPCRPRREQELELQLHSWESKREAVSIQHVALQNQKAYKSKNSVTGKNKKCGVDTSIKGLRGSQKNQQKKILQEN